jgi:hypothetical protein
MKNCSKPGVAGKKIVRSRCQGTADEDNRLQKGSAGAVVICKVWG